MKSFDWKHVAAMIIGGALAVVSSIWMPGFKDAVCGAGSALVSTVDGK